MKPLLFSLPQLHPLNSSLCRAIDADAGELEQRLFPDGESYLRLLSDPANRDVIILADLSNPDSKFLPLYFLAAGAKEMGASSVGLVAPYLSYMRQDKRFHDGEVITSRHFAQLLSQQFDWLVTVDPHLHRYHSLDEVYDIPGIALSGATLLGEWLRDAQSELLLVGPDAESEQWVQRVSELCDQPFVVGNKIRHGDRDVEITLPDTGVHAGRRAILIDDVISSGQTLLECAALLRQRGFEHVEAMAVHGLFAGRSDQALLQNGIEKLVTTNSVVNAYSDIDLAPLLRDAVLSLLQAHTDEKENDQP